MKKNILIIAFLIVAQTGAFTLKANAQDSTKILLADEATISYSKNTAKIVTDNDAVAKKIKDTWQQVIRRYSEVKKKDRHGVYIHYMLIFNKDDATLITNWAKTNL